jgi:hypothetical protein
LNRVRQGYIEMESPHPVLHHVAHGFSLAPARHSDGLSIRVSGHGVRTGGASHPHLCRHALVPNIWSTAATCARCTRSWGTLLWSLSGVMSTRLRTLSGSRPHSSAGARRGETHGEIRDQIALTAMCVHRAALVLTYNAAVRRPQVARLQPGVLSLHMEKEMREFR